MSLHVSERAFSEMRRVLRFLLLGLHPETGEPVVEESAIAASEVREALAAGIDELQGSSWVRRWQGGRRAGFQVSWQASPARTMSGSSSAQRSGVGWSLQEDQQIAQEVSEGQNLTMMATNHQRSRGSILARLVHLGLRKPY